ncbi:dTDP-4-dehydrorhamnose reductase [Thermodesulfatator indicus DSM 15286]|uniref:dTDP-4-dehydrorhamnose reductase n=1 Tax=Thermodesulfatator indicus (strain DSM 15286 / JCM 11887 / CIR29812) TaxID=667014 RepID=F8AC50_THEID|nr:dTDP-4-dehydrorhamnose reductase [Thermodesulfatator indicus]AEH44605.1 dTDP-4-dehydrorhamnose reductase [Thermodesulfatator indicus DSM 15286]
MKVLILGKRGQLGSTFGNVLREQSKYKCLFLSREECDIGNLTRVLEVFKEFRPDVVINCAAYNLVDRAEEFPWEAMRVNFGGVCNLVYACRTYNSFLVHYSTDYVFDGEKEGLYTEEDDTNPLNNYGKSKLYGENFIRDNLENYLIFRTSWVYGEGKQNFLYKLMQWAEKQEYLRIACDEFSVPTSTRTIVEVTLKALDTGLKGLYHLVNSGYASRYEWAKAFFKIKGIKKFIYPASQADFDLPAKRPRFSAMSNSRICKKLNIEIADWREELVEWLGC